MQQRQFTVTRRKALAPSGQEGGTSVLNGQSVLIVGMARSGVAAAQLLHAHGAIPILYDQKPESALSEALKPLEGLRLETHFGEDVLPLIQTSQCVVISPGVPVDSPVVTAARLQGVPLMGELEMASRMLSGELCAITGTNGKTTTVTLMGEILKNAGRTAHTAGNIGYPLSLAALLSRDEDVTVAEVSSFQLETVQTFRPHAAALLNITEDHLNRHGTMDEYIRLKLRIFENQSAEDAAILNMDDEITRSLTSKIKSRLIQFSRKYEPEGDAVFVRDGQVIARLNDEEQRICAASDIRIPGPHNLENALAAIAMAVFIKVPKAVIRHTLRTFPGVEHRIELVRERDCVRYINDSKGTNADSTIKAVEAMDRPTVIILGGYDKHVSFDALSAIIAAHPLIHDAVLIGQTAPQIEDSLLRHGYTHLHHAADMESAVQTATALAQIDGNVLLSPACASFDMFSDYEARGRVFKEIVMRL